MAKTPKTKISSAKKAPTGPNFSSQKKLIKKQTEKKDTRVEEQYIISKDADEELQFRRIIRIINHLIEKNHIPTLEKLLKKLRPFDISYISEFLDDDQKSILFSLIPSGEMAEILPEMSKENRAAIFQARGPGWIAEIIDNMDSNDAADVLGELPPEKTSFILKRIDKEDANAIKTLLEYEETSAGGIMATEFLAVSFDATVSQIITEFKTLAEKEDIGDLHSTFVIDKNGGLLGSIPLRKLVLYRSNTKVAHIMDRDLITVNVNNDQEEVASIFKRHNLITVPVVDDKNVLIGRITIDDIVDVIEEETSEDIYKMAGVGIESSVHATAKENIIRRLPWLLVNLATAAVSAFVVSRYESVIEKVAILAAFMPMVAGLGGNAGSQVIAIAVRSLALGELTFANAGRVLLREVFTGAANGIFLGVVIGIITTLLTGKMYLGIVICWAMVMNVFTASIAGLLVPLGLKKIGVDPAIASNIFVTPMTDTLGFFFFLGLAKIFLEHLI